MSAWGWGWAGGWVAWAAGVGVGAGAGRRACSGPIEKVRLCRGGGEAAGQGWGLGLAGLALLFGFLCKLPASLGQLRRFCTRAGRSGWS